MRVSENESEWNCDRVLYSSWHHEWVNPFEGLGFFGIATHSYPNSPIGLQHGHKSIQISLANQIRPRRNCLAGPASLGKNSSLRTSYWPGALVQSETSGLLYLWVRVQIIPVPSESQSNSSSSRLPPHPQKDPMHLFYISVFILFYIMYLHVLKSKGSLFLTPT